MKSHRGRTLTGPAGTAVEVLIDEVGTLAQAATLAAWLLYCPGQTPAWDRYLLSMIHLRPIEGARPAVIALPSATHEVLLTALDPDAGPTPDDPQTWHPLRPYNLAEQVILPDDRAAVEVAEWAAREVLAGRLWAEPPLSGQVEPWRTSVAEAAAHLRDLNDEPAGGEW